MTSNLASYPKISVLIPCHNIEKLTYFSLISVLKSRYKNIEILLLNDYSTDNTINILNEFAKLDPRIKVIDLKNHHHHVGIGFNRHFLIEKSTGEYFIFIDDDDRMLTSALGNFEKVLREGDYDLIASDFKITYELLPHMRISVPKVPFHVDFNFNDPQEFFLNSSLYSWGKLIKKQYYLDTVNKFANKFSGNIFEDVRFMYFLFLNKPKFKFINKRLFTYQIRPNSLSSSWNRIDEKIKILFDAYTEAILNIKKYNLIENDNILSKVCQTFYIHLVFILYANSIILKKEMRTKFSKLSKLHLESFCSRFNIDPTFKHNLNRSSCQIYNKAHNKFFNNTFLPKRTKSRKKRIIKPIMSMDLILIFKEKYEKILFYWEKW